MTADTVIPVSTNAKKNTLTDASRASALRAAAAKDPEAFWAEVARRIDWIEPFSKIKDVSFDADDLHIKWFEDGVLNACVNCLDQAPAGTR